MRGFGLITHVGITSVLRRYSVGAHVGAGGDVGGDFGIGICDKKEARLKAARGGDSC